MMLRRQHVTPLTKIIFVAHSSISHGLHLYKKLLILVKTFK